MADGGTAPVVITVGSKPVGRRADGSSKRTPRVQIVGPVLRGLAPGDQLRVARDGDRIVLTPVR